MIHDATGKFSSRYVLPDRSSLALIMKSWLHSLETMAESPTVLPRMRTDRKPHIGEYDPKTNATSHFRRSRVAPEAAKLPYCAERWRCLSLPIARGPLAPGRRPCSTWDDSAEGRPEW